MTAEIFLAVFLAMVLVAALQWVFIVTVYQPVQRWLANRAWEKLGKQGSVPAKFAELFPAPVPLHNPASQGVGGLDLAVPSDLTPEALRSFNAGVALQMAALSFADNPGPTEEGRFQDAALAFRNATTPTRAKELREMAEFHRSMQRGDPLSTKERDSV
jgi:hypothetical protein